MFEWFRRRVRPAAVTVQRSSFADFTDRARRVLVLAQEEVRLLNHNFIGTEHILLGLIREGEGVAAKALESLGISLDAVREKVQESISPAGTANPGSPPLTPGAKKVLDLSRREALEFGHRQIGTEHMLLGLVREGEGVASQVLIALGIDLSRVRMEVMQMLSGYPPAGEGGSGKLPPRGTTDLAGQQVRCSFCGKEQNAVRKLIAGPGVYICNECVELSRDIIVEEVGVVQPLPPSMGGAVSEGIRSLAATAEQLARDLQGLLRLVDNSTDESAPDEPPAT